MQLTCLNPERSKFQLGLLGTQLEVAEFSGPFWVRWGNGTEVSEGVSKGTCLAEFGGLPGPLGVTTQLENFYSLKLFRS